LHYGYPYDESRTVTPERSVRVAARNNAEWCHRVCASHGAVGRFDDDAWTCGVRTPPLYPDAVTLVPGCGLESVLARVDRGAGCSVKDSYCDLALDVAGFVVLFEAKWLWHLPPSHETVSDDWTCERDGDVAVLADSGGASAVANVAAGVIGLTNVTGSWLQAAAVARSCFGQLPVVGYELEPVAGVEPLAPLRVWVSRGG
jgi:hypothetical protein